MLPMVHIVINLHKLEVGKTHFDILNKILGKIKMIIGCIWNIIITLPNLSMRTQLLEKLEIYVWIPANICTLKEKELACFSLLKWTKHIYAACFQKHVKVQLLAMAWSSWSILTGNIVLPSSRSRTCCLSIPAPDTHVGLPMFPSHFVLSTVSETSWHSIHRYIHFIHFIAFDKSCPALTVNQAFL